MRVFSAPNGENVASCPARVVLSLACLIAATGCELLQRQSAGSSAPSGSTSEYGSAGGERPSSGTAADAPAATPTGITTGLPDDAAHPSVAWILARMRDIPNVPLGRTAQTRVTALEASSFLTERAIGDIVPNYFRTRHLPRTADKLARVRPISDPASFQAAQSIVAEAETFAQGELATLQDNYSDHANAEGAARGSFEVLHAMLADVAARAQRPPGPIEDAALRPWYTLLDFCNDDTQTVLLERGLAHYVKLLRTGRAPARTERVTPRLMHPAVRTYLYIAGERLPLGDYAQLLGVDATDTLHGRNVDVALIGADVALRELAPRVLDLCNAHGEATAMRATRPIRDERTFIAARDLLGSMGDYDDPNQQCVNAAQNMSQSVGEASDAFGHVRQDINSHPYYARGAIVGWVSTFGFFSERGVPREQVLALAVKLLTETVAKLRRLPRRSETSREPD